MGRQREIIREVNPLVEELQHMRESARLSQYETSCRLGLGKEAVGHWERGKYMIDLDDAQRYAALFGYELVLRKK